MNQLTQIVQDINNDLKEIRQMLADRSKELERREKFDEEISRQIREILNKREYEHRHTRIKPDDSRLRAGRIHAGSESL